MKKFYLFTLALLVFAAGCGSEAAYEIKETSSSVSAASEAADNLDDSYSQSDADSETADLPEEEGTIYVYVCGEVANPGVYELAEGSRMFEAIEAAGGLTGDVDTTKINMAQKLSDGQQITVTADGVEQEAAEAQEAEQAQETASESSKVNINTADKEELMTLSGIGESRAEDIIEFREKYGNFSSIEEIMNISGIGEKMFEKIKDDIEV